MSLKRLAVSITVLVLGLWLASTAQAKNYSITGGGGEQHIGNGLALPIQSAIPNIPFPTAGQLKIPVKAGATVMGTTAMTSQQKLTVPKGVLSKPAGQTTVGVLFSNPAVYAVATNATYTWPRAQAMFSTGIRTALSQTTTYAPGGGRTAVYSPGLLPLAFGGAARFSTVSPGGGGLFPVADATVFVKAGGSNPPCVHTAFAGADPGCRAFVIAAYGTGLGQGNVASALNTTMGTPAISASVALSVGLTPSGTILMATVNGPGPNLMNGASSRGFPFTAGRIVLSVTSAIPPENFTISGMDSRTTMGAGTIQMVASSLSTRFTTGPNANRAWVQLDLTAIPFVPTMSPTMIGLTLGALMLVAIGSLSYVARRRSTSGV